MTASNLTTDFNSKNKCSSFFFIKFADKYAQPIFAFLI